MYGRAWQTTARGPNRPPPVSVDEVLLDTAPLVRVRIIDDGFSVAQQRPRGPRSRCRLLSAFYRKSEVTLLSQRSKSPTSVSVGVTVPLYRRGPGSSLGLCCRPCALGTRLVAGQAPWGAGCGIGLVGGSSQGECSQEHCGETVQAGW